MSAEGLLLDGLLVMALLATALAALVSRDLFRGVVMFIAFGLLMTLAWIRLAAPDIALAEAAISAGLTGVLLLDAVSHLTGGNGRTRGQCPAASDAAPRAWSGAGRRPCSFAGGRGLVDCRCPGAGGSARAVGRQPGGQRGLTSGDGGTAEFSQL
ncbi:Na(+)/H(+) antiporter subunit B [Kineobactrum salinum]|uniref:DUF4040 domain-containing protein n=1 Tax=Kineobactrum salinum TaxID=2708301 RepID=A0A6C0U3V0_9GAMM|nr:DUF4040 domain-containing protein [Kineobactrum salinum]QIB65035.1 DUF4040 domain-containing protein [Kineobactrum salinum]